ncbi:MAG: response regulator [Candidatus Angelobacter sp.]
MRNRRGNGSNTAKMPVKILLADDHAVLRQGLRVLLEREGFEVVGEASDGREAVKLCDKLRPDVALLDVTMPLLNGIDAAREIMKSNPRTKVVLLTMHTEDHLILESLRAGVTGYVLKTKAASELVQALRAVCRGEMFLTQSISRTIVQAFLQNTPAPGTLISDRERQVLQLVAEGKTTKEIASLLGISVKTAESHRSNLMDKLNIHDTAGLVRYAIRIGLIES